MGNARANEAEQQQQQGRAANARTSPPVARGARRAPGDLSPADVLALQQQAGNQVASAAVQRAVPVQTAGDEQRPVAAPTGARRRLGDWVNAQQLKNDLLRRLSDGPLFSEQEIHEIQQQRPDWLKTAGIGTYEAALEYTQRGEYRDWLQLGPGRRLLIATLEFRGGLRDREQNSPAYTLGRRLHAKRAPTPERTPLEQERDQQIRDTFVETLHPREPSGDGAAPDQQKQADAQQLLTRIFLILQNGLKIRPESGQDHIDYRDGDVARALAHGGRVNIRIPPLSAGGAGAYELMQWLEATDAKGNLTGKVSKRDYATHHMSISEERGDGREGAFKERGGGPAAIRNKLPWSKDLLAGSDAGMGGMGKLDCNGDLIMPNGAHGHLLLVYVPPEQNTAGGLQIGLETLAPGNTDSPVGYVHNWRSTEATSNPESAVHGHKQDKIGKGKLRDNQRFVNLAEFPQPWAAFLRDVERDWNGLMAQAHEQDEKRQLIESLVGRRGEGRFPYAEGTP